jgi:hypothetical protein
MSKFEKLVYVGCPWFFGMVLVVVALLNASEMPQPLKHKEPWTSNID